MPGASLVTPASHVPLATRRTAAVNRLSQLKAIQMRKDNRKPAPAESGVEKMLYDRKSAAWALSVSVRTVDYELARGTFDTRKIGTRTLITAASLKRYAASNHFGSVAGKQEQEAA